jgi:monothiol glutaredoxin
MSDTNTRIEKILSENKIVLFMKGSPQFPQCGFSARATAILNECGVKFHSVDVLQDPDIRDGIKTYGNWPTIPQLYVNKELIGGSDIMMEMFEAGELQPVLKS